jgi:hypothetical protein
MSGSIAFNGICEVIHRHDLLVVVASEVAAVVVVVVEGLVV